MLTDRFRVRKPFMIVGTAIGLVGSVLFALSATSPRPATTRSRCYFILASAGGGMAYVAWMASFTETVEKHNPAATATGLAIWGWILRIVVTASLAIFTLVVPATSILVDQGITDHRDAGGAPAGVRDRHRDRPRARREGAVRPDRPGCRSPRCSGRSPGPRVPSEDEASGVESVVSGGQLATVAVIQPATLAALQANPLDPAAGAAAVGQIMQGLGVDQATAVQLLTSLASPDVQANLQAAGTYATDLQGAAGAFSEDDLNYLSTHGPDVAQAAEDNPHQWQTWWWVCIAGQIVFLPFVFVMAGRWSPRRASRTSSSTSSGCSRSWRRCSRRA